MDEVKAGWQTTEFWMNLLAVTIAYLMTTDLSETAMIGKVLIALAAALAALGYTASRAVVKREQLRAIRK